MRIALSEHFTYKKLLRFVLPSVVMMIFTSIYGIVDGFFISNYVGKAPFAAVNLIIPYSMIFGSFGFMIGAGGSALVSHRLGEQRREKANELFSLLVYVTIGAGIVFSVIGALTTREVAVLFQADEEMLPYCVQYGVILMIGLPGFMLQNVFQSFFITAEKPKLGLAVTLIAGVTNMALDWLFMAAFSWGVIGAAIATIASQMVGGVIPLFYFARKNSSLLRLTGTHFEGRALLRTCTNGSSELLTNVSMSLLNSLYNVRLMQYAGEDGVAAFGTIMYVSFIFLAVFFGYAVGSAPVIGYHYGAKNEGELKNLFKKSLILTLTSSVLMLALAQALAHPLAFLYASYDPALMELTENAFRIYFLCLLFAGFNVFSSAFFTALGNGIVSAVISFSRVAFQVSCVLLLPLLWGIDGIWSAVIFAELGAFLLSVFFLFLCRKKYRYC